MVNFILLFLYHVLKRAEFLEMREFGSHSARSTSLERKLYFTTDVCSNGNSILGMELLLCSMILQQIVFTTWEKICT